MNSTGLGDSSRFTSACGSTLPITATAATRCAANSRSARRSVSASRNPFDKITE